MKTKKDTKRTGPRRVERIMKPSSCYFCDNDRTPDYKDIDTVSKYVTDRARILGRNRSGLCAKHQRQLTIAVKRIRHLGLLPFKASL